MAWELLGAFIISLVSAYALLIWYSIRSWHRLQPNTPFLPQARALLLSSIIFAVAWCIIAALVLASSALLALNASDSDDKLLEALTFLPLFPYYAGLTVLAVFSGINSPIVPLIAAPLAAIATVLLSMSLLLLVSLIEWVLLRFVTKPSMT